jgi:hypothetical protein
MHYSYTVRISQLSYKLGVCHTHGMSLGIEYESILLALLNLPWGIYTNTH